MSFSIGIVGLPNVGKSTLFNAVTRCQVEASNYPFCTIDPNIGIVSVPDERLSILAALSHSKKITPTMIDFVDIAGLVKGASQGEGLGNQFLAHIREVKAIAHVVRCFEDENIIHVDGRINPEMDIDVINIELIMADLTTVTRRLQQTQKRAKSGDKELLEEVAFFEKVKMQLEQAIPLRRLKFTEKEAAWLADLHCLSAKPVIYIANVMENEVGKSVPNAFVKQVQMISAAENAQTIVISAKIEAEISELSSQEAAEFLKELGIAESGLKQLTKASYALLGLITYLTTGETETRAWTIIKGMKAPQAAGVIHTDFERGFIKAEIVAYQDFVEAGSLSKAREKGVLRQEGKEYVMQDGDVVEFRFNV